MIKEKPELNDAMQKKMAGKQPKKNPIKGTKFTIAISSAKGGVGKSTFATNLALALKNIGCDTAKSVLDISSKDLVLRTDLEKETVDEVLSILSSEFED